MCISNVELILTILISFSSPPLASHVSPEAARGYAGSDGAGRGGAGRDEDQLQRRLYPVVEQASRAAGSARRQTFIASPTRAQRSPAQE